VTDFSDSLETQALESGALQYISLAKKNFLEPLIHVAIVDAK